MANTAYSKDDNEEIYLRDLGAANPAPELLQVRTSENGLVFYARSNVVVRGIYSDLDSLSAFAQSTTASYYLVYHRDHPNASAIFLELVQGEGAETLGKLIYGALPSHVQQLVPPEYIKF